MTFVKY